MVRHRRRRPHGTAHRRLSDAQPGHRRTSAVPRMRHASCRPVVQAAEVTSRPPMGTAGRSGKGSAYPPPDLPGRGTGVLRTRLQRSRPGVLPARWNTTPARPGDRRIRAARQTLRTADHQASRRATRRLLADAGWRGTDRGSADDPRPRQPGRHPPRLQAPHAPRDRPASREGIRASDPSPAEAGRDVSNP